MPTMASTNDTAATPRLFRSSQLPSRANPTLALTDSSWMGPTGSTDRIAGVTKIPAKTAMTAPSVDA